MDDDLTGFWGELAVDAKEVVWQPHCHNNGELEQLSPEEGYLAGPIV